MGRVLSTRRRPPHRAAGLKSAEKRDGETKASLRLRCSPVVGETDDLPVLLEVFSFSAFQVSERLQPEGEVFPVEPTDDRAVDNERKGGCRGSRSNDAGRPSNGRTSRLPGRGSNVRGRQT
ncbi:hypothetical protein TGRUB_431490 [Toxoplasma gondii RUB]|uniref:Uncharacterized protein n=1 Tax=Toxoplasma gondii RUB TaxID=935652 RepID=A0A086LXD5_TOXGO|nr:hypothetical protein TGRUB_431490 [Toxoplasma gondii RUB]